MYKGLKIIAMAPAYNEEAKIGEVVRRTPRDVVDCMLVIDDGSTDRTAEVAKSGGAEVISLDRVEGVGYALREGLRYAQRGGFDVAIIMAGNNKDDPSEIPQLVDPIVDASQDLVMGSRFLKTGGYGGDMPAYRKFATRLHPRLMSFFLRKKLTESTNGFRAIRVKCLDDARINLDQKWLDGYALEVYLLFQMIKLGYRHTEVPCTKIYPPRKIGNTKMRPIVDWWDILRPVFLLGLGIRR
jgi:dolichol-phosphate mannosyltransferase